jgi:hypothetical protein
VRGNNCFLADGTYVKPGLGRCDRGTAIYLDGPTVECANVYVLPDGNTRSSCKQEDVIRNLNTTSEWSGHCVNWRYVTKDRQWVMVRDPRDIHYGGGSSSGSRRWPPTAEHETGVWDLSLSCSS